MKYTQPSTLQYFINDISSRNVCRFRYVLLFCSIILLGPVSGVLQADEEADETPLVQKLIEQYQSIESVSCDVRRDVTTPEGTIRWLSRVYFQADNKLHAANARPQPRLILADGETMYQHSADEPRGFRRAIEDLNQNMRINLSRVPGTLMDHLLRLTDAPETVLDASEDAPIRRAYEAEHVYAILEADEKYRLRRVLFYQSQDRTNRTAEIVCDAFEEVLPDTWIAMQHRSSFYIEDTTIRERTRFTNYEVNLSIPEEKFRAEAHFSSDIEWVDSFDQL